VPNVLAGVESIDMSTTVMAENRHAPVLLTDCASAAVPS
jgi:isopentenyl diphosphate isomerase/L-lactate dehydrogenase-like FMN-dependent dehydrogenase